MLTYLEEIMEGRDPRAKLRKKQHALMKEALEKVTDDSVLKVVCLLSEASMLIHRANTPEQVLCMKLLQNIIHNVDQFAEAPVAAMFERDLYEREQH